MGNVGSNAAKIFYHRNACVVAISDISGGLYCADGLNIDAICDFMEDTGKLLKDYNADGVSHISNEEVLACDCDVLVPAALENQITADNCQRSEMFYYRRSCQWTNLQRKPDAILEKRGITVVPDIFANSGGVIVSYFEWVQNIQELTWERNQVNEMLENLMKKSFEDIMDV